MQKILIIYEYGNVRELLTEELAADGHLVVPIGTPALAKDLIGILRPDLVLLNLHINGKDRWDVLKDIKGQDPNLPVLVLSTYSNQDDLHRSLTDVYVMKSLHFEGLRQKVAEVLKRESINAEGMKRSEKLQPSDKDLNPLRARI